MIRHFDLNDKFSLHSHNNSKISKCLNNLFDEYVKFDNKTDNAVC